MTQEINSSFNEDESILPYYKSLLGKQYTHGL